MADEASERRPGIAVDASGGPVIDPTKNVLDLVQAAIQRQDDLRAASNQRQDDLRIASERRNDELNAAERKRIDEVAALRATHSRELNEAETKRIDAIRAVDVAAVGIATERAAAAATVLANQVSTSAETLRALVASTATASASQQQQSTTQLSDRIALLERASYEGSGKSAVADPAMARMVGALEKMQLDTASAGGRTGVSQPLLMAVVAALSALAAALVVGVLT